MSSGGLSLESEEVWGPDDILTEDIQQLTDAEVQQRILLIENEIRVMRQQHSRLQYQASTIHERLRDLNDKIKLNKQLPYLVANVIEILRLEPEPEIAGEAKDIDVGEPQSVVIKTSTRQTIFLPVVGLIPASELRPNDLVGVNKDSYLILDKLPAEYDSRVKAMEIDERPTDEYSDIGGLDKQIEELIEAAVLPMTHPGRFEKIGIRPPKGVLLFGPPGTGKTLLARACAAQTKATFLKLAGPHLVQMFIGEGAKLVRDAFNLAKEKAPAIIFIG